MNLAAAPGLAASWDPQVKCPDQVDPGIRAEIWNEALVADGVDWAPGLRRVPPFPTWNWNRSIAERVQAPTLLIWGELDQVVPQQTVQSLFTDLQTEHKALVHLPCASHYAAWETQRLRLFQTSLEWLRDGSVNDAHDALSKNED
jgi:pimeloyl-ACP methyl ester carboxylesterase